MFSAGQSVDIVLKWTESKMKPPWFFFFFFFLLYNAIVFPNSKFRFLDLLKR